MTTITRKKPNSRNTNIVIQMFFLGWIRRRDRRFVGLVVQQTKQPLSIVKFGKTLQHDLVKVYKL